MYSQTHNNNNNNIEKLSLHQTCLYSGLSEAGRHQDVHVSGFELVGLWALPAALHRGDLHLGRAHGLSGGAVSEPRGLRLHHLHGARLLGAAVRLQRKAS